LTNTFIITILLIALAVTAGLLIYIVVRIMLRKEPWPASTGEILARILDVFPVPVFEIDSEHKVTQWNSALEALSGIKKENVLGTSNQWRAFYPEKRPVLADLIADGAPEKRIDALYKGKAKKSPLIDGAYDAEDFFPSLGEKGKWYRFTASPIRDNRGVVGAIEILEDVTDQHIAEQNLRYYVGQVTRVQEEERKHLARELHDTTVQTMVALIYQLDNFFAGKPKLTEGETDRLRVIYKTLQRGVEEVRRFSRDLRPPVLDDLGLVPGLQWLAGELKKVYNVDITVETTGEEKRLPPEIELALFRIIQEALRNAAKHAMVKAASLSIAYLPEKIEVNVIDSGEGFDLPEKISSLPRDGKLGLAGIAERLQLLGGKMEIHTGKGRGTSVYVEIPL
jgi:signal transduction histidine kinase